MNRKRLVFSLAVLLIAVHVARGANVYVSPDGDDANPGTKVAPVLTLARARDVARRSAGKESTTVTVASGVYYLPETLFFGPGDSGSERFPVTYRAETEGAAVISGGVELTLEWHPFRDGLYRAATEPGLVIDQLFIDGEGQRMARYPNFDPAKPTAAYQGYAADAFSKERAAAWADPTGGYVHAMHRNRWGGYHYRITGKDSSGEVVLEGGWQNNRRMGMHEEQRMVENVFEELDAPGEWFHDPASNTLYFQPPTGVDPRKAKVEVVRLRRLIEFRGSADDPVHHITIEGFVVRHAARTFMDTREPLLRSDWAIYRGGACFLTGTEQVAIRDTEFDQVGGNAIFVSNYNRRVLVEGCHIHDTGASGVCFVGDPEAVRNPLFEYGKTNNLSQIDRTPGPKTDNYPADSVVADCLIHGIGLVERQPAGVQISMSRGIIVRDTSVYDCARAGINIGDGCWGGHLIDRCDVFDTVLETHDHGSFNSWGRDRFWHRDRSRSQVAVDADPRLPRLDAVETTVIRNSRWRCDHGWDIDLDDGSTNYDIYNNLMLRGGLKLREGFHRRAWNNITVNNGFHPHVWYDSSQDEVFSNIFMTAHRGARMPSEVAKGKRVDENLFFVTDPTIKDRHTQFGWDVNSLSGEPLFIDPASGDFRVAKGSPAFEIGFENFAMDQFGVKKPSLRAIARTPKIPRELMPSDGTWDKTRSGRRPPATEVFLLGAKLRDLRGEEYSAYGSSKEQGGVVLDQTPVGCDALRLGFRENDLIQAIDGRGVAGTRELLAELARLGDSPATATVLRDQQEVQVQLTEGPYLRVTLTDGADGLPAGPSPSRRRPAIRSSVPTANEPLYTLTDGKLGRGYGPVFPNGVTSGAYKMDLRSRRSVAAVRSWSFNKNGNRGAQVLSIYGSDSTKDPGWNTTDRTRFTPLGSLDTRGLGNDGEYVLAELVARSGKTLGQYRWIVWRVTPLSRSGENTSYQELAIELAD